MSILHPLTALDQQINLTACDHRCDGTMGIGDGAVFMVCDAAIFTVDGGRREILESIQGHQQIHADRAVGLQMPQPMQRVHRVGEDGKHRAGRNRIEQIANLVVARGLCHPEQALGVAASHRYLQSSLEIQERRALGEEDRECPHGGIRHGIFYIITRTLIWKLLNARSKDLHKTVEGLRTQS